MPDDDDSSSSDHNDGAEGRCHAECSFSRDFKECIRRAGQHLYAACDHRAATGMYHMHVPSSLHGLTLTGRSWAEAGPESI